jgi:YesN/AraC family two-component response regulator
MFNLGGASSLSNPARGRQFLRFSGLEDLVGEQYGFEVITASDGMDALTQFKAHSGDFGAIVTDHDMPHMNGMELVRSVREIGFKGRIVVMSGRDGKV